MTTLDSIIKEWREQRGWNFFGGPSEGSDTLQACADRLESYAAEERKRPTVVGASPVCLDCNAAGLRNCSHFDNCNGRWVYAPDRKLREGLEKLRDKWKQTAKQRLSSSEAFILGTSTAYDVAADELSALLDGKE